MRFIERALWFFLAFPVIFVEMIRSIPKNWRMWWELRRKVYELNGWDP